MGEENGQELRQNDMRQRFYKELSQTRANAAKNCVFLTDATYEKLVNDVITAKTTTKKEPRDYWLLKRYDVLVVENNVKLFFPGKGGIGAIQFYVKDSELFDVLHEAHLAIGHGGRDKMSKELAPKYKNITRHDTELYIHLCEPCQRKQKSVKKGIALKPVALSDFNSRCQVDVIDFQSHPDQEYKFLMVYQDHLTKFVVLKPLKSKSEDEVAYNLIDVFTLLGAPSVLQSDNGREFANKVVCSLKEHWPTLKIVHGKPRQGSVEQASQDIQHMLSAWMQDEKSDRWSEGTRFVQLARNRSFHSGIQRTPYEALFGCKVKVGLTVSSISEEQLRGVQTEEELEKIIASVQTIKLHELEETGVITAHAHEYSIHQEGNQTNRDYEDNEEPGMCCVCFKESSSACTCRKCGRNLHAICGHAVKDGGTTIEGYGDNVWCDLCFTIENAVESKRQLKLNLEVQAKKMKMDPDKQLLNQFYVRPSFSVCRKDLLKEEDTPNHKIALCQNDDACSLKFEAGTFKKKESSDLRCRDESSDANIKILKPVIQAEAKAASVVPFLSPPLTEKSPAEDKPISRTFNGPSASSFVPPSATPSSASSSSRSVSAHLPSVDPHSLQESLAKNACRSLAEQQATTQLIGSMSRSLDSLAESVHRLVQAQQQFSRETLQMQRDALSLLRDFSSSALNLLQEKINSHS